MQSSPRADEYLNPGMIVKIGTIDSHTVSLQARSDACSRPRCFAVSVAGVRRVLGDLPSVLDSDTADVAGPGLDLVCDRLQSFVLDPRLGAELA